MREACVFPELHSPECATVNPARALCPTETRRRRGFQGSEPHTSQGPGLGLRGAGVAPGCSPGEVQPGWACASHEVPRGGRLCPQERHRSRGSGWACPHGALLITGCGVGPQNPGLTILRPRPIMSLGLTTDL
ncbi:hypothetical protein VULLAG_LOCUS18888 [Vulpes lagopus]